MKKTFILSIMMSLGLVAWAQNQTLFDAINLSATELNGTARFVGVGGAMGALGGDASTLFYNPAGIGVYRSSELTISGNIHWANTRMAGQNYAEDVSGNLANLSYIGTWMNPKGKGLISLNFGVAFNRIKNFNRVSEYDGTQDYSIGDWLATYSNGIPPENFDDKPYLNNTIGWNSILAFRSGVISPRPLNPNQYFSYYQGAVSPNALDNKIRLYEYGGIDEYAFSFGGNVADIFYWGMSFMCDYGYYSKQSNYYEYYPNGKYLRKTSNYTMEATGFTYKLGVIVKPVSWLRIGAAFHTPTWYNMHDWHSGSMEANVLNPEAGKYYSEATPDASGGTDIVAPLRAMGSLGFVLGKWGFIGIDYEYANYQGMEVETYDVTPNNSENTPEKFVDSILRDTHTIRLGIEVRPIQALSLRLGGGYTTPCTQSSAQRHYYFNDIRTDTDYFKEIANYNVTAGAGYRFGRHAIDLAYVWQVNKSEYSPFSPTIVDPYSLATVTIAPSTGIEHRTVRNQMVLTYSVRF